jgi:hypothetical protein
MSTPPATFLQALDLGEIIGGPLQALIKAQALAAQTSAQFISEVGLLPSTPPAEPKARTISFEFTRSVEDPNYPGQFIAQNVSLTVPFLSIVPVPFIRIDEAEMDFEVRVIEQSHSKEPDLSLGRTAASPLSRQVKINAAFTERRPIPEKTDLSSTIKIHIKLAQQPIPEGLARTLGILHDSIVTEPKPS